MDRHQFLDRLVAPGNFLAVVTKGDSGLIHRFYKRADVGAASSYTQWAAHAMKWETWFGLASYSTATLRDNGKSYFGRRTQDNAQNLKCFWFDADIKRDGDKKNPAKVFANETETILWVKTFCRSTGMPLPNVWVVSGYGMHLYWSFEDALHRDHWQPYAEALKAALTNSGAKGDTSIVADSARILRPIETWNYKVPASPAPVFEYYPERLTRPDYPNAQLLGAIAALPHYSVVNNAQPSPVFAGRSRMTANAKAGIDARPRDFALIANQCAQVGRSFAEGGANDGRQLWHPLLTLTRFCENGRQWAHAIGCQHPTYSQTDTDKEYDRVEAEHKQKSFGAPLCTTFDAERPGVCDTCPHRGAVTSPFGLGSAVLVKQVADELPTGWRRYKHVFAADHVIEYQLPGKNYWLPLINGNVLNGYLERVEDHLRITFDYTSMGLTKTIQVENTEIIEPKTVGKLFCSRGVPLNSNNALSFRDLIMAWIDKLRMTPDVIPYAAATTFGWIKDRQGDVLGLSVGATLYKTDGTQEPVGGGDKTIIGRYQPKGSQKKWQEAAELIIGTAPEFQLAFAVAFGAPLMEFAGEPCMCLSFVGASGRGKTSAFRAGASVWGDPVKTTGQLDDTENYISKQVGSVRSFPIYWDEVKVRDRYQAAELKTLLHKLTQGRDRGRLTADVQVREAGDWQTIFPFASNDSLVSALSQTSGDNAATLLRLLEIPLDNVPLLVPSVSASKIVSQLNDNYGHAGRKFIEYVVARTKGVSKVVDHYKNALINATNAVNDERFFIAGGAAILAGAYIANKLQLVNNLDLAAMQQIIVHAIRRAHLIREQRTPTDPRQLATNCIAEFCDHYTGERIITQSIPTSGFAALSAGQAKFVIYPPTSNRLPLAFQIGVRDRVLRINRRLWEDWCLSRGRSPDSLAEAMLQAGWLLSRLADGRGKIGANTAFGSEKIPVLELNLSHPDLAHYADDYQQAAGTLGGNVVPLQRPPAQQPTI